MSKSGTWADVKKHDVVELGGRNWSVVKIKAKGKKATVVVDYKGREAESKVKLSDPVTFASKGDGTKRGPLVGPDGANRRWATNKEHDVTLEPGGLPAGDSSATSPPAKLSGDPWEKPRGKTEAMIADLMQAKLVGESTGERVGYYVPPVDVATVAAHLALFHGGIPEAVMSDEAGMLSAHAAQHLEALTSLPLAVNHWHTETRPSKT